MRTDNPRAFPSSLVSTACVAALTLCGGTAATSAVDADEAEHLLVKPEFSDATVVLERIGIGGISSGALRTGRR